MAPLDQETPLPLALVDLAPGLAKSAVKDLETSADHKDPSILAPDPKPASAAESPRYRTYKRRWVGLFGLFLVNLVNAVRRARRRLAPARPNPPLKRLFLLPRPSR